MIGDRKRGKIEMSNFDVYKAIKMMEQSEWIRFESMPITPECVRYMNREVSEQLGLAKLPDDDCLEKLIKEYSMEIINTALLVIDDFICFREGAYADIDETVQVLVALCLLCRCGNIKLFEDIFPLPNESSYNGLNELNHRYFVIRGKLLDEAFNREEEGVLRYFGKVKLWKGEDCNLNEKYTELLAVETQYRFKRDMVKGVEKAILKYLNGNKKEMTLTVQSIDEFIMDETKGYIKTQFDEGALALFLYCILEVTYEFKYDWELELDTSPLSAVDDEDKCVGVVITGYESKALQI